MLGIRAYKRRWVHPPVYGKAPIRLIAAHRKAVRRMARLYHAGVPLTSAVMLDLCERADELSRRITEYNSIP